MTTGLPKMYQYPEKLQKGGWKFPIQKFCCNFEINEHLQKNTTYFPEMRAGGSNTIQGFSLSPEIHSFKRAQAFLIKVSNWMLRSAQRYES